MAHIQYWNILRKNINCLWEKVIMLLFLHMNAMGSYLEEIDLKIDISKCRFIRTTILNKVLTILNRKDTLVIKSKAILYKVYTMELTNIQK